MNAADHIPAPRKAVTDARLWHPWLRCRLDGSRISRVLRVMLHTRWHATQRAAWDALRQTR